MATETSQISVHTLTAATHNGLLATEFKRSSFDEN
jgi:hypothetical protein